MLLLVLLSLLASLAVTLLVLYLRERQARREAETDAARWRDTCRRQVDTMLLEHARERDAWARRETVLAERLATIRATITRRPPRRRWLRVCHRVAMLADA